jgi:hypothetical protein
MRNRRGRRRRRWRRAGYAVGRTKSAGAADHPAIARSRERHVAARLRAGVREHGPAF